MNLALLFRTEQLAKLEEEEVYLASEELFALVVRQLRTSLVLVVDSLG